MKKAAISSTGLALAMSCLTMRGTAAQEPRRLNLARYSFSSPAAEREARVEIRRTDNALTRALDTAASSPRALATALAIYDSLTARGLRHSWYLRLRCATNVGDPACDEANAVNAELSAAGNRLQQRITKEADGGRLARARTDPALRQYSFFLEDVLRSAGHSMSADAASAVAKLRGSAINWQFPEYLAVMSHVAAAPPLRRDATSAERAAAYRARFTNVAAFGDLLAAGLVETVRGQDALAQVQGYLNAPVRTLETRYLALDSAKAMLAALRAHGGLTKRYELDQLAHASLSTADTTIGPWDLARAQGPATAVPLDSAIALMKQALAPLGAEYAQQLACMLDPSAERLDLGPGAHRTPGGFSFGAAGFPTGVYLAAYDPTAAGARRLAHETGHAMHRQMMIDAGTAPVYLSGAPWLSEAVSLFNELAVMERGARNATNAADRARFEEAFFGKALDVLYSAQDAELELGVYDGVESGRLRTAADLDSLSRAVDTAYTIWAARVPERAHRWMTVRLMWEDPLYLVNYVYADLVGLKLLTMYERNPADFGPRYVAFLRAGYSDTPAALIKRHFGFELNPHALLDDALELIDERLSQYETQQLRLIQFSSDTVSGPTTSTVIVGPTEAAIVDALYYRSDARREADSVAKLGKRVTAIFITHPHEDHYFGVAAFVQRFPQAKVYMTPAAAAVFTRTKQRFIDGLRKTNPSELPDSLITPTPLTSMRLAVDGVPLEIIPDLQGDVWTTSNSIVWIPSLRAVIAGDIVFNREYAWTGSTDSTTWEHWRESLTRIAALEPAIVIAGHKKPGAPDTPDVLRSMDAYIRDFETAVAGATDPSVVIDRMRSKYPEYGGYHFLRGSAEALVKAQR